MSVAPSILRILRPALSRCVAALLVTVVGVRAAGAQTYTITDISPPGDASVATAANTSGQVAGYTTTGPAVQAWRFTPGAGIVILGSLGGSDGRAFGINDAGRVTGSATDAAGLARGFVFSDADGLIALDAFGAGAPASAQHINTAGQIAGFSSIASDERAFLFSPPNLTVNLGTLPDSPLPATSAAYGVNDAGRVVGIASSPSGFNRAFRTEANGATMQELGTLGGDDSWALAINNAGQVVGLSSTVTTDAHAFLFADGAGMIDLGTLGGYVSTAFALNNSGLVVGSSDPGGIATHAFAWSAAAGMRDLNDLIPPTAGWVLTEARAVTDSGLIVGSGLHNGQPRAFVLTPNSGPDLAPPVAAATAPDITAISPYSTGFQVTFWDDTTVAAASIGAASVRVTGPNGFSQLAVLISTAPTLDAMRLTITFAVAPPGGLWNGPANGVYTIAIEPNQVHDVAGNFMPASAVGSFRVATETKPVFTISAASAPVMNLPLDFTLTAKSSYPSAANDVFTFVIDWNSDGTDLQTVTGGSGTVVSHTFTSIGSHQVQAVATDLHGGASAPSLWAANAVNPPFPQAWSAAPVLTGNRHSAVGLNAGGTIVNLGGLPLKAGKANVQTLTPGAAFFVDGARLLSGAAGVGAGVDALGRIIVYGGIEPGATVANVSGYVYTPANGAGAAIAPKNFAVHDFAFTTDAQHRLYSIGGAGAPASPGADGMGMERYDGSTNTWTILTPLPEPRVSAACAYDGRGHVLVIGGLNPTTGSQTTTVFSYDIAANAWSLVADAAITFAPPLAGRVAALGADGLVYLIGGVTVPTTYVLDPASHAWYAGPSLALARGAPAVTLGDDGFIYVMGGDNPGVGGNNGLSTVEKLDTKSVTAPEILTSQGPATLMVGNPFRYQMIASGNPRPIYSLGSAPVGMTMDTATGIVTWTPTPDQTGNRPVLVRATSAAGTAEQVFTITVVPIPIPPTDVVPPTAPASIAIASRTATTVTLFWPPGSDDVGVTSYRIYGLFRGSRSSHIGLIASGITNRSYISHSFATGYYVAAVDAAGNQSALSPMVADATLTRPVISHFIFSEPATVTVGSGFLFTLVAAATPSPTFTTLSGPAGMTLSRTSGPNPLNDYAVVQWMPTADQVGVQTFTVFATNPNTSGGSATFSVTVQPAGFDPLPPTPVGLLSASAISFDRCTLTWTPAGDNIGVTNYAITATHFGAPGQANQVITLNVPGSTLTTSLNGLLPGAGYTVSIRPSDAAGNIGPATSIFLTTLHLPLAAFRASPGAAAGTLSLDWVNFGAEWIYAVEYSDSLTAPVWQAVGIPLTGTHLDVTPPAGATHAFYRVRATPIVP